LQGAGKTRKRNNSTGETSLNCRARHAIDDAGIRALGDRKTTGRMDGTKSRGAVFPHSGHQHSQSLIAKLRGDRMEEDVDGGPVPVDARLIHKNRDVSMIHAAYFHVAVARAN
jgi:hypothetical protein